MSYGGKKEETIYHAVTVLASNSSAEISRFGDE